MWKQIKISFLEFMGVSIKVICHYNPVYLSVFSPGYLSKHIYLLEIKVIIHQTLENNDQNRTFWITKLKKERVAKGRGGGGKKSRGMILKWIY